MDGVEMLEAGYLSVAVILYLAGYYGRRVARVY